MKKEIAFVHVREKKVYVRLLKDLSLIILKQSKQLGKPICWFQFAKWNGFQYIFLKNKEAQWEALTTIIRLVSIKHRAYTEGQIADILSELVNTTAGDVARQAADPSTFSKAPKDKRHLDTFLITLVGSPYYVPRYPWLRLVSKKSIRDWKVKDCISGKTFLLRKNSNATFWMYIFYTGQTGGVL